MVYGMQDVAKVRQMIEGGEASEDKKAVERRKLNALLAYCETARCRRQVLLEYFNDSCEPCGNCDTCLEPVETFDGTEQAQKALSAVYRTDQRYGAGHVIDVLRGEMTERVRSMGHHRLPTFGVGKDTSKEDWQSVLRQLTALGHIRVDVAGHGSLLLGPDVRPVLRGEEHIRLRKDPATRRPKTAERRTVLDTPEDEALFHALRSRRMDLAKAQGVPPYVIFHDATLVEIARARPLDLAAMGRLPGIGATKLDRYGADFLEVVTEFQSQAAQ